MASDAGLQNEARLKAPGTLGFDAAERQVCTRAPRERIGAVEMKTGRYASLAVSCLLAAAMSHAAEPLEPADAVDHIGEQATVCGEVTGAKFSDHRKRKPTFIDFGPPHPNQLFTALIWGEYRDSFDYAPESLLGKSICVSGTITEHKGKPEIKVSEPSQIRVMDD